LAGQEDALMIADDKPNPFAVLGLPTSASPQDIAERAQELDALAESDSQRQLYRWARERIITHPRTRLEYEVFEVPGTDYEQAQWKQFERKYRRNPVNLQALSESVSPPSVGDFDLPALIDILLDGLLDVLESGPLPVEVRDVVLG
jgi:hypothetical protein